MLVLIVCLRFVCGDRLMCFPAGGSGRTLCPCCTGSPQERGFGGQSPPFIPCFSFTRLHSILFLVVCGLCDSLVSCACSSFEPLDALTAQALRAWHDVHACNVAQSDGATPPALEVLVTVRAEPLISVLLMISVGRLAVCCWLQSFLLDVMAVSAFCSLHHSANAHRFWRCNAISI